MDTMKKFKEITTPVVPQKEHYSKPVLPQTIFEKTTKLDVLRESYFRGELFSVGDLVESDQEQFTVVCRGSNYVIVENDNKDKFRKWLHDVTPVLESDERKPMKYSSSDKIKVAKIIAGALGIDASIAKSSPEEYINAALRKIRNKPMHSEYIDTIKNMLSTADDAGIKYDQKLIPSKMEEAVKVMKAKNVFTLGKPGVSDNDADDKPGGKSDYDSDDIPTTDSDFDTTKDDKNGAHTRVGNGMEADSNKDQLRRMKVKYKLKEDSKHENTESAKEESDEEIEDMIKHIDSLEDILDVYDDDELHIVDEDGTHVSHLNEEVEPITEVLSRIERIRAKLRFAKSASKRERKLKIALHTKSSTAKINHRARVMAIKLMKEKIAKKPLSQLSLSEKERLERIIQSKKKVLNRMALKLSPRIRAIESARLHPIRAEQSK